MDDLPEESASKKKKGEKDSTSSSGVKTPLITLSGHTESISSCQWIDEKTVSTASWDHSIRVWDVFVGQEVRSLASSQSKIFLATDYSALNRLIAAGLNDSVVRVYDHRSAEGNLVKVALGSSATAAGWCSSVCWSKSSEHSLLTGSYDNLARVWDIRKYKRKKEHRV